ncbi:P-loop NTPase fold protein [Streptomyces canus]|uniref:P-loop NTPase fold protein n=1 Tax=Streptomyces canus TaxID=58343 RepID=UPI002E300432|nr:P-loop NTPase fold protein [Streptomyces canus]
MESVRPWAIEDVAIARSDEDLFDHRSVAEQLARTVRQTTGSMAVGLIGPFGSGKSSVVQLLTSELAVNPGWAVLHVSAEHHTGVARARALLYALIEAAHHKKLIDDDTYAVQRSCLEGSRQRTLPRATPQANTPGRPAWWRYLRAAGAGAGWVLAMLVLLWLLGVGAVAAVHLLGAGQQVSALTWFAPKGATSLTGVLVSAAAIAAVLAAGREGALQSLKAYEITVSSPRPESTDELEQAFSRLLSCIKRRLVIAVDDIDRLAASDVLDALATVRSFLLTGTQHRHQPVFLLSCDEDIVREAIVGVRPGLAHRPTPSGAEPGTPTTAPPAAPRPTDAAVRKATEEAAQEYLNKLFTIRLVLPAHYDADLRDYAEELLLGAGPHHPVVAELGGPTQTRTLLEVLIHRQVRDPRHVLRLLNSFFSDFQLARRREQPVGPRPARISPGEATGHPIELARLTVLRHDFRDLYDAVYAEHRLLHLLDDALLGLQEAVTDPLLAPYTTPGDQGQVDLGRHPGLAFLKATAARARTQRPSHIGPLITLGSSRASRLLGSQLAWEIEDGLVQRNGTTLAAHLAEAGHRVRVLEAATASLEAAREGQDLNNAVVAVLEAIGSTASSLTSGMSDDEWHAMHALTDCVMRQHDRLTLPVPSHLLVPLLDLTVPAHVQRLRQILRHVPTDTQEARTWAVTLLDLPAGKNAESLAPALDTYFDTLGAGGEGDSQDLAFWQHQSSSPTSASWPPAALAALLTMAAHDDNADAVHQAGTLIIQREDDRGWGPVVLLALRACLSSISPVYQAAVEILVRAPQPSADWGQGVQDSESTLLATQLIEAVTLGLRAEDDPDQMVLAMDLLTRWLPAARQLPEAAIATGAIANAAAVAATVRADLTAAAGTILAQLPEEQAASCASLMAAALPDHRDLHDGIGTTLRDTLIDYLRRSESATAEATRNVIANCLDALTVDVEVISPTGRFTRSSLPQLLTTAAGLEMTTSLINRLSGALPSDPNQARELLPSLHVLLRDPAARDAHLPAVIARVQPFISSAYPHIALDFAAPYITTTALDGNWLNWFASQWPNLQQSTRTLVVAAAGRPDLLSVPALRDHLVQHLLETDDAEPWQYADTLWPQATTDQQSSLLAHADGRRLELAQCTAQADADLLSAALVKAGAQTSSLLSLIQDASAFDEAVALYLNNRLAQPEWTPEAAQAAIARVHDPAVLWKHVLTALTEDQSSAARAAVFLAALIEYHPDSVPDDLDSALAPVLREAEPTLATEIGTALRSLPRTARKLRKTMDGYSSTSAQRARNAAFKAASGI